jgi:hypothetical protein
MDLILWEVITMRLGANLVHAQYSGNNSIIQNKNICFDTGFRNLCFLLLINNIQPPVQPFPLTPVVKGFGGVGAGVRFKSFPSIIPLKFMTRKAHGRNRVVQGGH